MAPESGGRLLVYAVSKLGPDIFAHPVWARFGANGAEIEPAALEALTHAAKNMQQDEPGRACQLFLLGAALHNRAGHHKHALKLTQLALTVAEQAGLAKESIWCVWGACASCLQDGNAEQAARHLAVLQGMLDRQGEWVLAGYVDIVRQSLPGGETDDSPSDAILPFTFHWLMNWGFTCLTIEAQNASVNGSSFKVRYEPPVSKPDPSLPPYWLGWWRSFKSAISKRLKIRKPAGGAVRPALTDAETESAPAKEPARSSLAENTGLARPAQNSRIAPALDSESVPAGAERCISAVVQMLGPFHIAIQDLPVKLPSSRGLSLLKYLLLHHKQEIPRDILMDVFWPDADPEAARNNLNVAMHNLRQSLHSATDLPVIHFGDGAYGLAMDLDIWLDVEEFEHCIREGQRMESRNQIAAAVTEYEIAVNLYRGDLLSDTPYENWTVLDRERLRVAYLDTLDRLGQIHFRQERYAACMSLCQVILSRDPCREDIHYRLMQCFSRLGQTALALRQYQICVEALRVELDVDPAPETTRLYQRVRHREQV